MSKEVRGRNRPYKPILPTYSNMITEPWDNKENNYIMTDEQKAEVIAKFGPPKMPLSKRPKNHFMSGKKGKKGA